MMQNPHIASGEAVAAITLLDDPDVPGQVIVRIQATRREYVQLEIDRLIALVDRFGGGMQADRPFRQYNGYSATAKVSISNWGDENAARSAT